MIGRAGAMACYQFSGWHIQLVRPYMSMMIKIVRSQGQITENLAGTEWGKVKIGFLWGRRENGETAFATVLVRGLHMQSSKSAFFHNRGGISHNTGRDFPRADALSSRLSIIPPMVTLVGVSLQQPSLPSKVWATLRQEDPKSPTPSSILQHSAPISFPSRPLSSFERCLRI